MPVFVLETDSIQRCVVPASIRCYWSTVVAANGALVWMRVETRGVKDGASVAIDVHRVDGHGGPALERLEALSGTVRAGLFEREHLVSLPAGTMESVKGRIAVAFEARIDAYGLRAGSQALTLSRPRFSI
jgi:hypothetical protein